ncbi:DUF1909-domain-containing protein [Ramicandelaber brevisporus]|nr:DUF1909-domain-containing protein [Ramicandelaber brevisporus]
MANGSKTKMKQERNAKAGAGNAKSQLKTNEKAKNIICATCKQAFMCNIRGPALTEHALNKHNKTLADCFPGYSDPSK